RGPIVFRAVDGNVNTGSQQAFQAGVIHVKGDFTQTRLGGNYSPYAFVSTGTRVVFDGTTAQTVTFDSPGAPNSAILSHFRDVDILNAAGVSFASPMVITGQLTLA